MRGVCRLGQPRQETAENQPTMQVLMRAEQESMNSSSSEGTGGGNFGTGSRTEMLSRQPTGRQRFPHHERHDPVTAGNRRSVEAAPCGGLDKMRLTKATLAAHDRVNLEQTPDAFKSEAFRTLVETPAPSDHDQADCQVPSTPSNILPYS
jgi:hypothetical protein